MLDPSTFNAGSRRQAVWLTLALFVAAMAVYALDWSRWPGKGVGMVGAERVLAGDVPYRDFWTMYAPGQFYLLALLFWLFGAHLLVDAVAASVMCSLGACACFWLGRNLTGRNGPGLVCAAVFWGATLYTAYWKYLGSYPPASLLLLVILNAAVIYFQGGNLRALGAASLALGVMAIFKHDVTAYTALAVLAGVLVHHWLSPVGPALFAKLAVLALPGAVVLLPALSYFVAQAGPDMLQDLVIFPLTDFRFSRPENYPGVLPLGIYDPAPQNLANNLSAYVVHNIALLLFLAGLGVALWAIWRRRAALAAAASMLVVGFLLHYCAAHVQINTHIITMCVYAVSLAMMGYTLLTGASAEKRMRKWHAVAWTVGVAVAWTVGVIWMAALVAESTYRIWQHRRTATVTMEWAKVSGFKLRPEDAQHLMELKEVVDAHVPPGKSLYVGVHRHDVVIVGSTLLYYILDRPSATRYPELHPAITDTSPVQQEMIRDLRRKDVPLLILRNIFADVTLEKVKTNFLKNLPNIGATDLDEFIRSDYVQTHQIGPYQVWRRKGDAVAASSGL